MKVTDEVTEYCLLFKEGTEMYKNYGGEFFSEDKDETDELFEQFKEQIEQYYEKTWVQYDEDSDWYETDVNIIYDYKDYE